jgi:hypothetical protein
VTCSCRCENTLGNTSDGATYCTCPAGTTCTQVAPASQSGDPRAGGYCIKTGTAAIVSSVCANLCDPISNPCK